MSTRGFLGFVVDGQQKIAYNHSDSYPDGLGVDVLKWLRSGPVDTEAARALRVVSDSTPPTAKDIERLRKYADTGVGSQQVTDWYVLLRETQGDPAAILDAGFIEDASEFPADSLFAEYGYIVDLDAGRFDAYEGFQQSPHNEGRFASRTPNDNGYYPVRLAASWPLSDLPDEDTFMAAFTGDEIA